MWKYYIKSSFHLVLQFTIWYLFLLLSCIIFQWVAGCGIYEDGYYNVYNQNCTELCDAQCYNCWSWSSDILRCNIKCVTDCSSHGCDYISVPSTICDNIFQNVCDNL